MIKNDELLTLEKGFHFSPVEKNAKKYSDTSTQYFKFYFLKNEQNL